MLRLYPYVGPSHLARHATAEIPRLNVRRAADVLSFAGEDPLTVTFVVLPDGLWIADRHSEHVACARGGPVLSAGEITFDIDLSRRSVEVVHVSNQSTGFCPEPESWPAVAQALDAAGIPHPGDFTAAIVFRRCPACDAINIVKDGWFECAVCGGVLSR